MKVPENLAAKNKLGNGKINPFGRERLNSAFKKYDSDDKNKSGLGGDDADLMRSPLTRGQQGEPSFGADSGAA